MPTLVFFRNDDVGPMEPGLQELGGLFLSRGLPLVQAVVPAWLTEETAAWLLAAPPGLMECVQHGFAHAWHSRGEFGGARGLDDQLADMAQGKRLLAEALGGRFFPAMAFPWHLYNLASIRGLQELGYLVMSGIHNPTLKRRLFFTLGRVLGANLLLGRNVSHHGGHRPGTSVREISVSLDPILGYRQPAADWPHMSLAQMQADFRRCQRHTPVVGVLLHHAAYAQGGGLEAIAGFLDWLQGLAGVLVATLEHIHAGHGGKRG